MYPEAQVQATTNSAHSLPVVANLLDQQFTVSDPGTVYGTDIAYSPTEEGWLYLTGVKDLATKELTRAGLHPSFRQSLAVFGEKRSQEGDPHKVTVSTIDSAGHRPILRAVPCTGGDIGPQRFIVRRSCYRRTGCPPTIATRLI